MNKTKLKKNYNVQKDKLIQDFAIISNNDLIRSDGKKNRDAWKASNQTWQIKRRIAQADNRALLIHIFGNPSFTGVR